MSAITGLLQVPGRTTGWIDDRMNPIVVKELRQAVKSRFVVAVLMLMLSILMIILTAVLLGQDPRRGFDEDAGSELFLVFQSILLATCMLFVPLYVGIRLAAERSTATSDLIYVTTIRPSSIVWGKLLAGMIVTALTFSACAPFMVITYLLRGIDLPTILFVLSLDVLIVLAATQLAIFVGTMPIGWPVKAFLSLVLIGMSVMGFIGMTIFVGDELLRSGIGSAMDDRDFWIGMAVFVGSWLAGVALVFFLSVAMITPATANRALVPRLYFTLVCVGSFVGFFYLTRNVGTMEPLVAWLVGVFIMLTLASVISSSERENLGPRLRRGIPRSRLLRVPAFFFYSGAAGGLLWVQGLLLLSMLAVYIAKAYFEGLIASGASSTFRYSSYDPFPDEWLPRFASTSMWVIGYLLLSVIICRRSTKMKNGVIVTGVMGLIIMAAVSVVPMIIAYAMDPDRWDFNVEFWLLLNPFGPLFCEKGDWTGTYGSIAFILSIIFFVVMQLVNLPWYWRQFRGFAPPASTNSKGLNADPALDDGPGPGVAADG
ncbi:hypothetical protein [Algisphaera agarilytica]|uniref:ABC-2 family transporter protein n=1 Tax=Algisphaera agarilytica TaxID=1385975 RepID=A0A7X0LJQ0_9BACT|nr:hypothetical protein [Algisphaera agarilytica]MBB6428836.1 hypothetical protein [Algisphaera agarilytica]